MWFMLGMSLLVLIVVLLVCFLSDEDLGVIVSCVRFLVVSVWLFCLVIVLLRVVMESSGCVLIEVCSVCGCGLVVCLNVFILGSGLLGSGCSLVFVRSEYVLGEWCMVCVVLLIRMLSGFWVVIELVRLIIWVGLCRLMLIICSWCS